MYPCRGVLHTPHKCPHRGQTNRPMWSDRPMCLFVITPSIPESFIPNDFRSLPGSFVGRMQYAPTRVRKYYAMIRSFRSLPGSSVGRMQYAPTMIRKCYATIRSFRSLLRSFVGHMQYAPTQIRKCYAMIRFFRSLPRSFMGRMQYAPTRVRKCYAMIRSFRSLPESFVGRMQYAPTLPDEKRRSQNVLEVLFWVSKSSQNVFVMLFEAQNRIKMFLWCFLRLKIESKCFCGSFWG